MKENYCYSKPKFSHYRLSFSETIKELNFCISNNPKGLDLEELELELIDYGIDELFTVDDEVYVYAPFDNFGLIQHKLESKSINILSSEFERIPTNTLELDKLNKEEVNKLINLIEEDNDVLNVFNNLK